ncbi:MAG: hypothetical protein J0H19_22320 [Rhodospirillales bacterium]|nr:hypothetical protein [Rhodospirillales bacterium]
MTKHILSHRWPLRLSDPPVPPVPGPDPDPDPDDPIPVQEPPSPIPVPRDLPPGPLHAR